MKKRLRYSLLLCGFVAGIFAMSTSRVQSGTIDGLAPCVVFLVIPGAQGHDVPVGSGFLVRTNETALLVTAAHVAKRAGTNISLIMPTKEGQAEIAEVPDLVWMESPSADVAVARLNATETNVLARILARSLPADLLSARPLPPDRDVPLTIMGYPLTLGTKGFVSPLSLETKAASGFITLPRFDNKQLATFIVLQEPSIQGMSGGPVFDTGSTYFGGGRAMVVRSGVSLVGLMHGTLSDDTGGKLGAVVPATEILKVFDLLRLELKRTSKPTTPAER
jgi:hypothetical protein